MSTVFDRRRGESQVGPVTGIWHKAGHEVIIEDPRTEALVSYRLPNPNRPGFGYLGLHEGEVWMSDDFNAAHSRFLLARAKTGMNDPVFRCVSPLSKIIA